VGHQHLPDAALWVVLSIKACLYEQGRPTLPRRSSSFTTAGSPDSRSSAPDSFTLGSLATNRQTAAGRATAGASALGSTRQHGSSKGPLGQVHPHCQAWGGPSVHRHYAPGMPSLCPSTGMVGPVQNCIGAECMNIVWTSFAYNQYASDLW